MMSGVAADQRGPPAEWADAGLSPMRLACGELVPKDERRGHDDGEAERPKGSRMMCESAGGTEAGHKLTGANHR